MKLDYVLGLKVEDFLERRLQTQVFKLGLAKSIHHARVLIRQRHIRVRNRLSTFHHSLFVLALRSTLTSLSSLHSEEASQDVSRGRTPRRARPEVMETAAMKSKLIFSLANNTAFGLHRE